MGRESKMDSHRWQLRPRALGLHGSVVLCLSIVVVFAGHGMIAAGLLLFQGSWDTWGHVQATVWGGVIAGCIGSCLFERRTHLVFSLGGITLLLLGWLMLLGESQGPFLTLVTSIPFVVSVVVALVLLLWLRSDRLNRQSSDSTRGFAVLPKPDTSRDLSDPDRRR